MSETREPQHPPSDPYGSKTRRRSMLPHADDRPVRAPLIAAVLVGIVLLASGIYLWRRPPRGSTDNGPSETTASVGSPPSDAAVLVVEAGPPPVTVSEARVVGCHDRGPKVTAPEECDHVASVEQALSQAIQQSLACVPAADPGGTIEYVADVSFARHKVRISLPRSGRSFRDRKVVTSCAGAVREAMHAVDFDGVQHQHSRYQIAITATYRGKT